MNIYTIPPDVPFLRSLAAGILAQHGSSPELLTNVRIFLPTRRACRILQNIFTVTSGVKGGALLLPRLQPIGDIEADELDMTISATPELAAQAGLIPPAISPLQRQILLARMIQQKDPDMPSAQSLALAGSLGRLIDQVHTEELDFSDLEHIAPDALSDHWKLTLEFLKIVTDFWPKILEQRGRIDYAARRIRLIRTLGKIWQHSPPITPVIAAGSTGSIPATADFLGIVASLPQGMLVLPGLDKDLDEDAWNATSETHPQATMKTLLHRLNLSRSDVSLWPEAAKSYAPTDRARLAQEIMRPAAAPENQNIPDLHSAMTGVRIVEAASIHEEASTIAVLIRETLESPQKTVCLVTPDRDLARRVSSALLRWNILVDDSAGLSLGRTAAGQLILSVLSVLTGNFAPVDFLAFLRDPLVRLQDDSPSSLPELERRLRGPSPQPSLSGIRARAGNNFQTLFDTIETALSPLTNLAQGTHKISALVKGLTKACENAAGGGHKLWRGQAGESAAQLLSELATHGDELADQDIRSFADIAQQLIRTATVRSGQASHPRITILGQMESRMVEADVMILAGLNEGSWPADPGYDPWMSRPMRRKFGLPGEERSIALSAHDFVQGFCSPAVVLTRSLKSGGAGTIPARWLQRLAALMKSSGIDPVWTRDPSLIYARKIDEENTGCFLPVRPAPCPPLSTRPNSLSVTWIEKWMRNPYRVYAEKILRLRPLDQFDEDADAADQGTLIHKILERFIAEFQGHVPPGAETRFLDIAREEMEKIESVSPAWHYWWPRLERIANWIVRHEREWRKEAFPWLIEKTGTMKIEGPDYIFTLTAKADRIDRMKTGGCAIIDYKTGTPPKLKDVRSGLAPQLPLEGLILEAGGFGAKFSASRLDFWRLNGGYTPGSVFSRFWKAVVRKFGFVAGRGR